MLEAKMEATQVWQKWNSRDWRSSKLPSPAARTTEEERRRNRARFWSLTCPSLPAAWTTRVVGKLSAWKLVGAKPLQTHNNTPTDNLPPTTSPLWASNTVSVWTNGPNISDVSRSRSGKHTLTVCVCASNTSLCFQIHFTAPPPPSLPHPLNI